MEKMREHVGQHILRMEISRNDPNIGGFCGRNVCQNKLNISSITNKKPSYKLESNCVYLHNRHRAPLKSSVREPCTNWLVKCSICSADIWTYMGEEHFRNIHPQLPCPLFITEDELRKVKK